ncbi:RNA polymerase sigma factor, sigma-70 family [Paenibacillus sp. 276b]|nr:RNA polymerase sigma factor, sigma-70 family [Paenibacillus sp. 276b]
MSSLEPVASEDYEKLHRAFLSNEIFTPELNVILESLKAKLKSSVTRSKDYSWSPEDIDDIVSESIKLTIEAAKKGEISVSFIGAALYNLKTVKMNYTTCYKAPRRKQVKGVRKFHYYENASMDQSKEEFIVHSKIPPGENYKNQPDHIFLNKEAANEVRYALNCCDPRTKTILWNIFMNNKKNKVIGQELGLNEGYVSKLKKRGLEKMKESLEDYFRD